MLLIKYENDVVPHNSVYPASGMTVQGCYSMVSEHSFNDDPGWAG
jgi:hypothetical protein